ncbi:alpha/beta hydrolase [Nocardiopsis baichengensis]|uniref:alpha/beta hydrolase n=1 Tax=Nocardiopsis baichengensis TaxID=280240 RepID=UPI000348AC89|nr:alpha/beta hydrolase [Nocardiopsis baichengensis]
MSPATPPTHSTRLPAPDDPGTLPLPPAAFPDPGVELIRGAFYAQRPGSRPLSMDLWLPRDRGAPVPVVVFVHGGGWRIGRRDDLGPRFRAWRPGPFARIARQGIAVACPDYRLSAEATAPAQLEDLTDALAWLGDRAAEIGVDPGRTVMWGESAGGHLAALTALTAPTAPTEPAAPAAGTETGAVSGSVTVRGCAAWYAPSDLTNFGTDHPKEGFDPRDPDSSEARLLGVPPAEDPEHALAYSPVGRVAPGAPPFLLMHGDEDRTVALHQSVRLAEALHAAGAQADLRTVPGGDHQWRALPEGDVLSCFTTTVDFFHDRLGTPA